MPLRITTKIINIPGTDMPLISETAQWESDIPLIKRGDKVAGGTDGLVNVQTSILADRTAYLLSLIHI